MSKRKWPMQTDKNKYTPEELVIITDLLFGESGETTLETIGKDLNFKLYEEFFADMDYGTQKGRTGTFDEWFGDHIEDAQLRFDFLRPGV